MATSGGNGSGVGAMTSYNRGKSWLKFGCWKSIFRLSLSGGGSGGSDEETFYSSFFADRGRPGEMWKDCGILTGEGPGN